VRTGTSTIYSHTPAEMAGVVRSMREFRHLRGRGVLLDTIKNHVYGSMNYASKEVELRSVADIDRMIRWAFAVGQWSYWRYRRSELIQQFNKHKKLIEKHGGFGVCIDAPFYNVRGTIHQICLLHDISCATCDQLCGNVTSKSYAWIDKLAAKSKKKLTRQTWWNFFRSSEWNDAMFASPRNSNQGHPGSEFCPLCPSCRKRYSSNYLRKYGTCTKGREIGATEFISKMLSAA